MSPHNRSRAESKPVDDELVLGITVVGFGLAALAAVGRELLADYRTLKTRPHGTGCTCATCTRAHQELRATWREEATP